MQLLRSLCANELVSEIRSPGGMLKLVVFRWDCGATTDSSTQASLLAADASLPSGVGNLFVADTDHGRAPVASWGGPEVHASWTSPADVVLRHDSRARIF